MWAVAGMAVSTMTCALRWGWWVSALLRRRCLLSGFCMCGCVVVFFRTTCTALATYESVVCVGVGRLVTLRVCMLPLPLLVGTGHTSCSSCMRVFFRGGMHSYYPFFFPRCWRPLHASSPSSRLGPLFVDLCPVGCGRGVGGGFFVFAGARWAVCCVFLPSPALFCPLLRFRRPSCLFTLVRFFRWWRPCSFSPYLVACAPLSAFVHVVSSPAPFSLPAPSCLWASSRLLPCVCVRLQCVPCFACGGLYAGVWYGHTFHSLCMWSGHVVSATPLRLPCFFTRCWRPRLAPHSHRLSPSVSCCGSAHCRVRPVGRRQCGWAWVLFPLRLCARCVAYSSPSTFLPYPVPSLASGDLLACSRSSVGGSLERSRFPCLVGGGAWLPPCFCSFIPSCCSAGSLIVCFRRHCISCFACGGLYV